MLRVVSTTTPRKSRAYGYKPRKPARRMRGRRGRGKVLNWLKKAGKSVNKFLKRSHLLSKAGQFLLDQHLVPPQYAPQASMAIKAAKMAGYGSRGYGKKKQTRRYGSGLGLAGGALRLAGARYY